MKQRFDELLPFYVNGTLSDTDRAWVEDYLREHPKSVAELHWYESLQNKLHEDVPAVSSEVGLDRAMHRIRTEGPARARPRRAASPSLGERLREFFASLTPQPLLRPALAGALAVVALQAVVIVRMADDTTELRAVRATVTDTGPYVKINFKPDAREADIRLLLVQINGSLAAGPGQLGDYYVRVPAQRVAGVTEQLKGSAIVDGVAVVDGLPAKEQAMPLARRGFSAALLAAAALPAWAATPGDGRHALVIGNGAYRVGPLKNPVNDAQAIAAQLRTLGFAVSLRENTSLRDMLEAFRRFSLDTRHAKVRVIFYAGHGVQVKGRNYLLPVDTEIRGEEEMPAKSADLNELLERLGAMKQGINIVILDACRNNPFSGAEVLGPDGRRLKFRGATPSGLAPVEAPLGSMVAFSTAPGGVALDNPNEPHSLYTKHLLTQMQNPGLPVELLFKQVRLAVARETGRVQVPWESSSLTGDFCFRTGPGGHCSTLK